ncbi:hypothetical protein DFJ77DRAFT_447030 [Powellomyces hirtus]|nr:hypothetical protein DFJ77DRAFT_447030 [Powellomyces hirtus]
MTRDKRKKRKDHAGKKAVVKSQKASKQASKAERKDARLNARDSEDEEDIELLLKQFEEQDRKANVVSEETAAPPPSPRANASFVASPLSNTVCYLFGGEHYNGSKLRVFNDLYKYRMDKKDWRKITCALTPGPRSGHQTVALTNGKLVLFGGEYASATQNQFHHWKDCWIFDLKENKWEKLDIATPAARSGHRMTVWKNFVVLFGGFYDNYKTTKYYDDLWLFDTTAYTWTKVETPSTSSKPSARSGFQFFTHNDTCYVYGGYCKKQLEGEREKGVVYSDMWALQMSTDPTALKWERVKKAGAAPPPRAGCAISVHKNRAVLFGGVEDEDEDEDKGGGAGDDASVCQNDMYNFALETKKWFPYAVKKPKTNEPEPATLPATPTGKTKATEPQFDPNLPHPRYNAMLAVQKNTLLMYGGLFERRKEEHTLDDLWSFNLDKQGPWECLQRGAWERATATAAATATGTVEHLPATEATAAAPLADSESDSDSESSDSGSESN